MRTIAATEPLDDVRLVELSREGDREAFGRIVERYQSLICALTYSACGSFQASEDLAQVTFITAWCQLRSLREPAKLKSWLCSIARNATVNSFRQQRRTPTANAEALDSGAEVSADTPTPRDHVISKEEEAILWRSLGELPPTYREPLVLFYRQQQSVAEVADALEVSQDVVRQRLSRGRTMLTEKVTAFVEGALRQTTPGRAFTLGVLAALPVMATSTKAAVVGATVAGGAAKAAASIGIAGAILGPIIGILGGWFGAKMSIESTRSARERQFMIQMVRKIVVLVGVFWLAMLGLVLLAFFWWKMHPVLIATAFIGALLGYCIVLMVLVFWGNRTQQRIRREEAAKLPPGTSPPLSAICCHFVCPSNRWSIVAVGRCWDFRSLMSGCFVGKTARCSPPKDGSPWVTSRTAHCSHSAQCGRLLPSALAAGSPWEGCQLAVGSPQGCCRSAEDSASACGRWAGDWRWDCWRTARARSAGRRRWAGRRLLTNSRAVVWRWQSTPTMRRLVYTSRTIPSFEAHRR